MDDNKTGLAADLVDEFVASRLTEVGFVPGLREAVVSLVADGLRSSEVDNLMRAQLRQLRGPSSSALPDAYLAIEALAEDALQRAAAGIRSARARAGDLLDATAAWELEGDLALALGDEPRLAVRAELARVPRPMTRPDALEWSLTPAPWAAGRYEDGPWPPEGLETAANLTGVPGGLDGLARVRRGSYAGWVQVGLVERQRTPPSRYPERPGRGVLVAVGLGLDDRSRPAGRLPFGSGPWQRWTSGRKKFEGAFGSDEPEAVLVRAGNQPMLAIANTQTGAAGVGEPPDLLVPTLLLLGVLGLEPSVGYAGLRLDDTNGVALVGRTWRGHPVHDGTYEPTFPAIFGSDVLLRDDLFDLLRELAGDRLGAGMSISHHSSGPAPDA